MDEEGFLTTEEVLEYLQVNLRTVYRLIKAGQDSGGARGPAVAVPQARHRRVAREPAAAGTSAPAPGAGPRPCSPRPDGPACWSWTTKRAIRDLLSKTLALAEYDVDLAPDGRTALERLRIIPYDLLITDLKMPGVDGLTVIREARRLKADIPVIIITGYLDRGERHRGGQPRRLGLSDQAVPRPPRAGRRCQGARRVAHPPPAGRVPGLHP